MCGSVPLCDWLLASFVVGAAGIFIKGFTAGRVASLRFRASTMRAASSRISRITLELAELLDQRRSKSSVKTAFSSSLSDCNGGVVSFN